MYCGISTLVWGILFGGYFGDVVDVVSGVFFGHEVSIPALWFIPLNDPMRLLIFSMLLGMIHLFTGLGIKGYMCIRDKRYLDFFCDVVLWYLLLIGLILMLLPEQSFLFNFTDDNRYFRRRCRLYRRGLRLSEQSEFF